MQEYFLQLVQPRVAPEAHSSQVGLPLDGGTTAPFIVDRGWVGPAGTYIEEWSIRRGDQVLYRHPPSYIQVRGHQTVRRFTDVVRIPLALEPGPYDITFVVEKYRMGSYTVDTAQLSELKAAALAAETLPPQRFRGPIGAAAPAAAPAPAAPRPAAAASPATSAPAYTGEDPALARERVYKEELAKGSDPRVAEARAKSAEMRAKKAAAASSVAATAPAAAETVAAAPAPAPAPAPAAAPAAATSRVARLAAQAPPGGGGMSAQDAAKVRDLIYKEAIAGGSRPEVAEAQAKAAEIRARRGPWWAPDWR